MHQGAMVWSVFQRRQNCVTVESTGSSPVLDCPVELSLGDRSSVLALSNTVASSHLGY
jgi:hypothetical protein